MSEIDLDDVQGLIVRGYKKDVACHLVLQILDPDRFRALLADLTDENLESGPFITVATNWERKPPEGEPATHCVNLGFTFQGLKVLVPDVESAKPPFPEAFNEGAAARGKKFAGEAGNNQPERWKSTLLGDRVHAILSVYADDAERLRDVLSDLRARMEGAAEELDQFPAHRLDGEDVEHFGYKDGLSQPTIEGVEERVGLEDPFARVPAGEFVLGLDTQRDDPWEPMPELGRNGSFAAFRVMEQDVPGFHSFLEAEARGTGLDEELLAAKLCGRWRNGEPLMMRSPGDRADQILDDDRNMFDYESTEAFPNGDHEGLRCPRGAHIRRAFPRSQRVADDFDGFKRRIVRRGMPYGPKYDPARPDDAERGLVGHFICASLANQYEYIMREWLNDGLFTGGRLGRTKDPLTGANDPGASRFSIPGEDVELSGFTQYVTTIGCVYLFLPSMTALQQMARPDERSQAA